MEQMRHEWLETMDAPAVSGAGRAIAASFGSGRYEVDRLLGEGGQKQVLLARDTLLDRHVVISILKTGQLEPRNLARFWREAQTMAQLGSHPNIVTVHDIGHEQGRPYIVSEYVDGGSIEDLLKAAKSALPLQQVLDVAGQVCAALAYAHARGVVHRDIKPGNIWLTRSGAVKLGDFGLALTADMPRVTTEGSMIGTAVYISPEQVLGHATQPASDLYSLGAVLYEMCTGRPPFVSDSLVGIISQHIGTPPVAPSWRNPAVPRALDEVILRLLAKAPEQRPQNAADVAALLSPIEAGGQAAAAQHDNHPLSRLAEGVFVGRDAELGELRSALNTALAGRTQLSMVLGEPGSGKTRLTEQLAVYARLRDAQVLVGRCYEGEGAPAFWPWIQVIRSYVADKQPASVEPLLGHGAAEIAQLVSEVRDLLPGLPAPPPLEPGQARFRLFDSIATFLRNAARVRPLVLILDDLHWADKPSLLLLQFILRELGDSRVLIVGTYRDTEVGRQHPLVQALGGLALLGQTSRIALSGLGRPHVARFIELTTGEAPSEPVVDAVYRATEGNPFFVSEVLKLMTAGGSFDVSERGLKSIPIPHGVRDVIARRLDHLSEKANNLLAIASVIGREFTARVLQNVSDLPVQALLELLDEAVAARVIAPLSSASGRYGFVHALFRETLYGSLGASRRVRLHRRIGKALEELYGARSDSHLPELAHHFLEAASISGVDKAVRYAVRAAERASAQLAYEEAANYYERALQVLNTQKQGDRQRRCDLLLALADAQTKAGNATVGWETFQEAAEMARSLGARRHFARAALGSGSWAMGVRYGKVDPVLVSLLQEALTGLDSTDNALRSKLLAQLALACYHEPGERRLVLSQQAVEIARRVSDPSARLAALFSRCITLEGYEMANERLAVATEIVRISEQAGNKEMKLRGHYRRLRELLELGDLEEADREMEVYGRLADELRQPIYLWLKPFGQSSRALLEGRFADCERLLEEALAIGKRAQDDTAALFYAAEMTTLRRMQGRFAELEPRVSALVEKYPSITGWQATLTEIRTELGMFDQARADFDRLSAYDFADFPRDGAWVVSMALLAQVCSQVGDRRRAGVLYELLLPFAERNLIIGSAAAFYGPASRQLGILASIMERWDEAERHFLHALDLNRRMGARPFSAFTEFDYALMLLARKRPEDRFRAAEMLRSALNTASQLGMKQLAADAHAALSGNRMPAPVR